MNDPNDDRHLERRLTEWLHATAPSPAPDLADHLLRRTAATQQRRPWWGWSSMVPAFGAAALAVVVLFVGLQLWKLGPEPIAPLAPLATPPPGVETPTVLVETPAPSEPGPSPVVPSPPPPETSPSPIAEVFPNGQSCHNDSIGYTVSYPAGWWANEALPPTEFDGRVPPCIGFAPTEFDMRCCSGEVLPAIYFDRYKNEPPPSGDVVSRDETTIDGHAATVRETRIPKGPEGMMWPEGTLIYEYLIELDDGDVLVVDTGTYREGGLSAGKYTRDREIIDRMMQTLRFDP